MKYVYTAAAAFVVYAQAPAFLCCVAGALAAMEWSLWAVAAERAASEAEYRAATRARAEARISNYVEGER